MYLDEDDERWELIKAATARRHGTLNPYPMTARRHGTLNPYPIDPWFHVNQPLLSLLILLLVLVLVLVLVLHPYPYLLP